MTMNQTLKPYRLEERTRKFAIDVRNILKILPRTLSSIEDGKQLLRSSGSVGANYIEACESLGKKNKLMHMRICLKEAKESAHWLELLSADLPHEQVKLTALLQEARELTRIFSRIVQKLHTASH
jgi:four helix bundle protein